MRAETIEDVLIELHSGQWFSWTDSKNKIYDNLILSEKIWDTSYTGKGHFEGLIDNPYDLPTKEFLESELKKIQDEYDAQEYARNRQVEYPTIQELVVALYDTDDKADIEAKRAEVKAKYPKP